MELKIKTSNGNLLSSSGETTILTPMLYNNNGDQVLLSNYEVYWSKDNKVVHHGVSYEVSYDDIDIYAVYTCNLKQNYTLTSSSNEIYTDASQNILTADITLYSSNIPLYASNEEIQDFPVNVLDYTIILTSRSHKIYGRVINVEYESIDFKNNFNSANELNFTVHKTLNDVVDPLWDKIIDFKFVYVPELNEYFEINVQLDDSSDDVTKTITAKSVCECELSQIMINETEINTEDDIARDDYVVTTFYNEVDANASLLHRVLKEAYGYTIGHVDETLKRLQRSFSIDGTSIYDFLTGDCAEQFNCIFIFDSVYRRINAYDLYTNCLNPQCGYRGEFTDICPECGGTKLSYFGTDTTIYVDKDNLTDSISLTTDTSSVKNCFKIVAGDDDMTAAVRNVNPSGSDYIYYVNSIQKEDMSDELVKKYESYIKECEKYSPEYVELNKNIYECLDKILYYTSSMMPTIDTSNSDTAATQAEKLTVANLSPVGLTAVTTSTSVTTVNSALKNYAKVYIKTGYFKVEVDTATGITNEFEYVGTDDDGYNYGTWYGRFKVTNYSDEDDVAYTDYMSIKVYDSYESFLEQKIRKTIANDDTGDNNIYDVLSIKTIENFKQALTLYSLNRLTSFNDSIQGVIDILVEADQASEGADYYSDIYMPYYNKLKACQNEMNVRQKTIDEWQEKYDNYCKQRKIIQDNLNLRNYLGENLYNEFSLYRREQTYSNDNYISDGLTNDELLNRATELIEEARKELYKSGELQHSISSTLYNLLQMEEFKPLKEHFQVGNWLRINVDGTIYRLRLISYEVSFGSLENINVEFSDVTKTADGMLDISSIQAQTQSLSGSYNYISKQAKSGQEANNSISKMLKDGLDTSVTLIKNADSEDVVIGKTGIKLRAFNDINNDYDPEQAAFIHNMLVFTRDNWRTAETALGKLSYTLDGKLYTTYGLQTQIMISGIIVSGQIYSSNYSSVSGQEKGTHFDLETGGFQLGGDKIVFDPDTNRLTLKDILVEWNNNGKIEHLTFQQMITGMNTTATGLGELKAISVTTDNLYANFAKINLAEIQRLYADSAFINTLHTVTQTTINSTVDTEYVKDQIVGHATIQDLFTDNFTIGSDADGSTVMNGSTMQFKDKDGNVYIQLGTDDTGGHSLIIRDSSGATLINGSGVTENAIADGLIINDMIKKKDTNYSGISGDRLNIDSVVTNINNGNTTIKSSLIYFDDEHQTLNTKLSKMQESISVDVDKKIAESGVYQAWAECSKGNVLTSETTAFLTCYIRKGNDIIDTDGKTYRYSWRRKVDGVQDNWVAVGKTVQIYSNEFEDNAVYTCEIMDQNNITTQSGDQLTDASDNELTGYFDIITANITIHRNVTEELKNNYYTKTETVDSVTTILGETDLVKVNGSVKELSTKQSELVQKTDSIETRLSNDFYSKSDIDGNYYTKSQVYSKEETPVAVTTLISNIDIVENNAGVKQIQSTANAAKSTADGNKNSITKITEDVSQLNKNQTTFEQNYNGFKTTVEETYATKNTVNQLVNGNNLLRNSSTLIFSDYIIGNILTNATGDIFTDANGNVLVD